MTLTPEHAKRAIENHPDTIPPVAVIYLEAIIRGKLPEYYLSRFEGIKSNLSRTKNNSSAFSLMHVLLKSSFDDKVLVGDVLEEKLFDLRTEEYQDSNKLLKKLNYIISHIKTTYRI